MKYFKILILALLIVAGLMLQGPLTSNLPISLASSQDEELETVQVTRWMDPLGREPITYREWRARQPGPTYPTRMEIVKTTPSTVPTPLGTIWVAVNYNLYFEHFSDLGPYLDRYMADLETQGYKVSIILFNFNTPKALRTALYQIGYLNEGLKGAVLIGDFPVPWFEMNDDFDHKHAEFPIDLYYMDLDGQWGDADSDGIFDSHTAGTGDLGPEIWIGRLTFSPLNWGDEITLLKRYFDKDHRYRTGELSLPKKGLAYDDDDWDDSNPHLDEIYKGNVTSVNGRESTTAQDYKSRIVQDREWVHVMSHGSPFAHGFYRNHHSRFEWVKNNEVRSLDPHALFYNLFICSSSRYVEDNYLGGWYIAGTYGLAAVGSTKTGSMLYFDDFYKPLGNGKTLGEAFQEWFEKRAQGGFSLQERRWFYGMTLLGDPALRVALPSEGGEEGRPVIIEVDRGCGAAGSSYSIGETIAISYSVSENANVTLYHIGPSEGARVIFEGYVSSKAEQVNRSLRAEAPGVETVVIKATTALGKVLTDACSYSVGGVSPQAARIWIDKGCGATYRNGERMTISLSVNEGSAIKIIDFMTTGKVEDIVERRVSAGETANIRARVQGPPGIETLVLRAATNSGKVVTSACSFRIP